MKRQQQEFKGLNQPKLAFGGSLLKKSHAKRIRPLDSKRPIHLVMRSEKAKGVQSMRHPRNFGKVNQLFNATAKKYGITVYELANVGNHLHAVIKLHKISLWAAFIRELSGRLAKFLQRLGHHESKKGFWDQRPFTRIAAWGKGYKQLIEYVRLNSIEAENDLTKAEQRALRAFRRTFAPA